MDLDEFRVILSNSRVDVWTLIDAAISVALLDYGDELKHRREGIVERLYTSLTPVCRSCDGNFYQPNEVQNAKVSVERESSHERKAFAGRAPSIQRADDDDDENVEENDEEDEELDPYGGLFDDEQTNILKIKEQIEDPEQSEDALIELLQSLADMDITFKALKETDIGRHVNQLRKNPSNDVKRLVKQLVRKWKDLVDEWVSRNPPENTASNLAADGDSPQQNIPRNPHHHHQVPDYAYSPNPHNGSSGSERNNSDPEQKAKVLPRREAPLRPPNSAPPLNRQQKELVMDDDKLASARRRLLENYREVNNAKKQRTIQVMDINEIPKPKNGFIAKNKGGFQGRNHR